MTTNAMTKAELYAEITHVIQGRPAAALSTLPQIWQQMDKSEAATGLTETARKDYVEAARLFRYTDSKFCREALSAIGKDFLLTAYPDFSVMMFSAKSDLSKRTINAVKSLFKEFGYNVPAAFYNVILETAASDKTAGGNRNTVAERLHNAVLQSVLLVTPVALRVHSILSHHGLTFVHVMNGTNIVRDSADAPFHISMDAGLKPAYLQNLVAAAFGQYGVNDETSGEER